MWGYTSAPVEQGLATRQIKLVWRQRCSSLATWKARQQMQLDSDADGLVHLTLEPGEHIFVHSGSAEALLMGGSSSWRAFQQP